MAGVSGPQTCRHSPALNGWFARPSAKAARPLNTIAFIRPDAPWTVRARFECADLARPDFATGLAAPLAAGAASRAAAGAALEAMGVPRKAGAVPGFSVTGAAALAGLCSSWARSGAAGNHFLSGSLPAAAGGTSAVPDAVAPGAGLLGSGAVSGDVGFTSRSATLIAASDGGLCRMPQVIGLHVQNMAIWF